MLRDDGWHEARKRGSHLQLRHANKPGIVTLPHPVKDIPTPTLRTIFRQARWDWPPREP